MDDERCIKLAIREYVDKEVSHLDEKYRITLEKNSDALRKAEMEMNRRLEGMNEFRDQLKDQAATFISRNEYVNAIESLKVKVEGLQRFVWIGIGGIAVLEILLKFIIK